MGLVEVTGAGVELDVVVGSTLTIEVEELRVVFGNTTSVV
jgi:hypothetical protein